MSDTQTLPDEDQVTYYGEGDNDQFADVVEPTPDTESTGTQDDTTEDAAPESSDTIEENTEPTNDGDATTEPEATESDDQTEEVAEETDEQKAKMQHRLAVEAFKNRELKRKLKEFETSQNSQANANQGQPSDTQSNAPQQASSGLNGAPKMPRYDDPEIEHDEDKMEAAMANYHIEAATYAQKQVQEKASIQQKEQEQKSKIEAFNVEATELAANDTSYKELVEASAASAHFEPIVAEAILESDQKALLHREILSDPDRLDRINKMTPYAAAREIAKIELSLESSSSSPKKKAPAKKAVSQAPEPIDTVKPSGGGADDMATGLIYF